MYIVRRSANIFTQLFAQVDVDRRWKVEKFNYHSDSDSPWELCIHFNVINYYILLCVKLSSNKFN